MKQNPFPGMNPWLEWHWGDVHTRLTTYASDQLQPHLPRGLRARVEEYVAVEAEDEPDYSGDHFVPDVRVIELPNEMSGSTAVDTAVAVAAEPLVVHRKTEPETLRCIQIIDTKTGHRVVTSIGFLSAANKTTEAGRRHYRAKQEEMLDGGVNLVEIDLLRTGSWAMAVQKSVVPRTYRESYRICVVRADQQHLAEVYKVSLREPLPTIRIPLRTKDDDVLLQLQPLIDTTYVNGGYEDIDYTQQPHPPLKGPDAEWADQRLREHGLIRAQ